MCIPLEPVALVGASEQLKSGGFPVEAASTLRLAWSTVVPEDEELASLSNRLAFQMAESEPLFASNLFRLTQSVMMSENYRFGVRPSLQILHKFREFEARACHFASQGNFEDANHWIEKAFQWLPDNIDTALKLVPMADARGENELGDKWFRLYYDQHLQHLERWPEDAAFHNNLAWLCAKLDRRLEEALSHAERACYLQPNDATYLDTLAEALF